MVKKVTLIKQALANDDFNALKTINPSYLHKPYMFALIINAKAVNCLEKLIKSEENTKKMVEYFINSLIENNNTVQEETYNFMISVIQKQNNYLFDLIINLPVMNQEIWARYMSILRNSKTQPCEEILDTLINSRVFLESIRFNINDMKKVKTVVLELMESIMLIAAGAETAFSYWKRLENYYTITEYKTIILEYIKCVLTIVKVPLFKIYKYIWCKPETVVFLLEKIKDTDISHANILYELEWQRLFTQSSDSVFIFCMRTKIAKEKLKTIDKSKWPIQRINLINKYYKNI